MQRQSLPVMIFHIIGSMFGAADCGRLASSSDDGTYGFSLLRVLAPSLAPQFLSLCPIRLIQRTCDAKLDQLEDALDSASLLS